MSIAALRNRINGISRLVYKYHQVIYTKTITHSLLHMRRGAGAKSKEKLLVVTYAMLAMGLPRLAEGAALALRAKTGHIVAAALPKSANIKEEENGDVGVKSEGDEVSEDVKADQSEIKADGEEEEVGVKAENGENEAKETRRSSKKVKKEELLYF